MAQRILVVDDDTKIVDLIRIYLDKSGYNVFTAYDGKEALELSRSKHPDLVVLDLMLPLVDGLDVCRILRDESDVPIIMLTAKSTEEAKLTGLDLGADDYVTKPFSPRELVARIRAVLRRITDKNELGTGEITRGDLTIDFLRRQVRIAGETRHLTPKEFKLLAIMAREPGRAFSRAELMEKVFGFDYEGLDRTVDVHVMNLRKKVEENPADPMYVQTVFGFGYKFAEDHDAA
jgi:DNA-binding response OmpR family regulator